MAVAGESRIEVLARPKAVHPGFLDNLQSVYWENKYCKDWSKADHNTKFCVSERLDQLLKPKPTHKEPAQVGEGWKLVILLFSSQTSRSLLLSLA